MKKGLIGKRVPGIHIFYEKMPVKINSITIPLETGKFIIIVNSKIDKKLRKDVLTREIKNIKLDTHVSYVNFKSIRTRRDGNLTLEM